VSAAAGRWAGWHLYLPCEPERFLLGCLAPLADAAPGRLYFLRYHDEGGPHLRIRLLPPPGREAASAESVEAAVAAWAGDEGIEAWRLERRPYDRAELYFGDTVDTLLAELLNEATSRLALGMLAAPGGLERTRRWLGAAALLHALMDEAWPEPAARRAALAASVRFAREAAAGIGRGPPPGHDAPPNAALDAALLAARAALAPRFAADARVRRTARLLRRVSRGTQGGLPATHALHLLCNKLGFTLHEEHGLFSALARIGAEGHDEPAALRRARRIPA
jgi:thiopeptide-type bacteriocin biosynthesis protein